ncbi:flavoprotein [Actinopolyspora sp. H202]|uniref:flavoprotein n=1 Tax=Actinopolyspora sp. H202 TaxID=1500456 RepID=UPI001A9239A1
MHPATQNHDIRQSAPVIGVVGCAAGGVNHLREHLVTPLLERGYRVAVTLTPSAGRWLSASGEADQLEHLTGLPVRWSARLPTEPKPHPPVNCYAVVPATATSVAKLALGLGDNQALTPVCEAIGDPGTAVVVFPKITAAHTNHPAWPGHLATLRDGDVELLYGEDIWPIHPTGTEPQPPYPWETILATIDRKVAE